MEGRVGHVMLLCFKRVPHISTWSIDHSSLHTNEAKSLTENVVVSNTNVVITEKKVQLQAKICYQVLDLVTRLKL